MIKVPIQEHTSINKHFNTPGKSLQISCVQEDFVSCRMNKSVWRQIDLCSHPNSKQTFDKCTDKNKPKGPLVIESYPGYRKDIFKYCNNHGLRDYRDKIYEVCMLFLSLIDEVSVFQEKPVNNPFLYKIILTTFKVSFPSD